MPAAISFSTSTASAVVRYWRAYCAERCMVRSEEGTRKRAATYLVGCLSYRTLRLGRGNGCKALCAASAADDECNESCWN